MIRYVYIGLIVIVSLIVLLFKIQNLEVATVSLLSVSVTMPVSLLVIVIYIFRHGYYGRIAAVAAESLDRRRENEV